MARHLTVRLVWHDRGWDGHICNNPKTNTSCVMHDYVRESRDDDWEEENAGKSIAAVKRSPPCGTECATFSKKGFLITHQDPLNRYFLEPVEETVPPHSCTARPYGRMLAGEDSDFTWANQEEQDARLQRFFGELSEGDSLVFFYVDYADELGLDDKEKIVVGVGMLSKTGDQLHYASSKKDGLDYPVWSRMISHNYPDEGVRIPYQEYITIGEDIDSILVKVPSEAWHGFSYVSETISDDTAISVLERVAESIRRVKDDAKAKGDWDQQLSWLDTNLALLWKERGRYPGISSVLNYLGFSMGHLFLKKWNEKNPSLDVMSYFMDILEGRKTPDDHEYQSSWKTVKKNWNELSDLRKHMLKLLCKIDLSNEQVSDLANPACRRTSGIAASEEEILENPYLLCESFIGSSQSKPISFGTVDRAIISTDDANLAENQPITTPFDHKRIRAAMVEILRRFAENEGHTFLFFSDLVQYVADEVPGDRRINPDKELILKKRDFYEEKLKFSTFDEEQIVQLLEYSEMESFLRDRIVKLCKPATKKIDVDWHRLVSGAFKDAPGDEWESAAQHEKLEALMKISENRFIVLAGAAGTGKTKAVQIFLTGLREAEGQTKVLLLAPTGKARVRLERTTSERAYTIHQILFENQWIDSETYALRASGGAKITANTVIIDEASMIPLDLFSTLFRAIDWNHVARLVLLGDSNQLPPIGLGRPFVDIVTWLRTNSDHVDLLTELTTRSRFQQRESQALSLADSYLSETDEPADDEILASIAKQQTEGDLTVHFWKNSDELRNKLNECLESELGLAVGTSDYNAFDSTLGLDEAKPDKIESWQILCPTRINHFGSNEINRLIQQRFRMGLIRGYRKKNMPRPFGDQKIVWHDKVIQIVNTHKKARLDGEGGDYSYIANGEIGAVVFTNKKGVYPESLVVRFSSQNDRTYRYSRPEVKPNLELAYAMTVHKAQGSDFDKVFLVIPRKARTLSREILYTGITRFRVKLILLIENDIETLLTYRDHAYSSVASRNTNLFHIIPAVTSELLYYPEGLVHRTRNGIMVRSKSEVIVGDLLTTLGMSFEYEKPLRNPSNPNDFRLPDFTIHYEGQIFYWEHLGMLSKPAYKERWLKKLKWYKSCGYEDSLITSKDGPDGEIDSREIEHTARTLILGES